MMKQDEMQTLASVVDSMHKLAEGLETLAIYLLRDAGEQALELPVHGGRRVLVVLVHTELFLSFQVFE